MAYHCKRTFFIFSNQLNWERPVKTPDNSGKLLYAQGRMQEAITALAELIDKVFTLLISVHTNHEVKHKYMPA